MEITLEQAIAKLQSTGDWSYEEGTQWTDVDISDYEVQTSLLIPDQLRTVLKQYGANGFDTPHTYSNFLAHFEDKTRSKHETHIMIDTKEEMLLSHRLFPKDPHFPGRFTLPMVFFGTADGGNAQLLMSGTDRSDNRVWLWNNATDEYGTGNNAQGLGFVAPTLFEFFYNLKRDDEI